MVFRAEVVELGAETSSLGFSHQLHFSFSQPKLAFPQGKPEFKGTHLFFHMFPLTNVDPHATRRAASFERASSLGLSVLELDQSRCVEAAVPHQL